MEDRNFTGDDTREFGPAHERCRECGCCVCEDCDGHAPNCSHHPNFYAPEPRDEWDSPCEDYEELLEG